MTTDSRTFCPTGDHGAHDFTDVQHSADDAQRPGDTYLYCRYCGQVRNLLDEHAPAAAAPALNGIRTRLEAARPPQAGPLATVNAVGPVVERPRRDEPDRPRSDALEDQGR